ASKGILRPGTPELRLKDMELDGVSQEVIYGILTMDRRVGDDYEALRVCYRVYSEWVSEFCAFAPGRFAAITPLSAANPEHAAEDLRYAASLGLRGVELKPSTAAFPFWDERW